MTLSTIPQVTQQEWIGRIAEKAGTDVSAVEAVLARFGVTVQSVAPRRRSMTLSSVRLCGKKTGLVEADHHDIPDQSFDYEWKGLGGGLWVVASDGNSAGKSSILNAFKAAIKGKFPGNLKPDVWKWLALAEVTFVLDRVPYRVVVRKPSGSERPFGDAGFSASLERCDQEAWTTIFATESGDGFENAISDFFMQELGFEKFHAYQSKSDTTRQHGWPAMGSALFLTGPADALFGDEVTDGLAIRLLQLFIGLPWVSTNSAVSAALKQVEAETERVVKASATSRETVLGRIAVLRTEREQQVQLQRTLPDRTKALSALRLAEKSLVQALQDVATEERLLASATADQQAAQDAWLEDRNRLQQLADDRSAGYAFRSLRPKSCPSCDAAVVAKVEAPADGHTCLLCGHAAEPADDEAAELTRDLQEQVAEATQAKSLAEKNIREITVRLSKAREKGDVSDGARASAIAILSGDDVGDDVERKLIGIDARLAELETSLPPSAPLATSSAQAVLKAALEITEPLIKTMQAEVLQFFSERLFDIAAAIGVENLRSVEVKPNRVDIVQGDTNLTFTKLNQGEKLRFRTAAALAAVETAKWAGVGRHPGFIVLDSPGSQEMATDDFSALLTSLMGVLDRHPDVQVIVGAVMRPEILGCVPSERLEYAEGDRRLF